MKAPKIQPGEIFTEVCNHCKNNPKATEPFDDMTEIPDSPALVEFAEIIGEKVDCVTCYGARLFNNASEAEKLKVLSKVSKN